MGVEARQLGVRAGLEQMSRSQGYADAAAERSRNPSILPLDVSPIALSRGFACSRSPPSRHDTIFNTVADLTKAPWLRRPNSVEQDPAFCDPLRRRVVS